jgi:hypothetical protein
MEEERVFRRLFSKKLKEDKYARALSNMIGRALKITRVEPHKGVPPVIQPKYPYIDICLMSLSITSILKNYPIQWRRMIPYNLWFWDFSYAEEVKEKFKRNFEEALKTVSLGGRKPDFTPHFICVNELGFPNPFPSDEPPKRDERRKILREMREFLQGQIRSHNTMIYAICGTLHDLDTFHNLSLIFHNDSRWEEYGALSPIMHAKKIAAIAYGEKIITPYVDYVREYRSEYGSFTILICLDCYDFSALIRSLDEIRKGKLQIPIVFVPACWPGKPEALKEVCEDLSFLCRSIVAYVNCTEELDAGVFVVGEPAKPIQPVDTEHRIHRYRIYWSDYEKKQRLVDKRCPEWFKDLIRTVGKEKDYDFYF